MLGARCSLSLLAAVTLATLALPARAQQPAGPPPSFVGPEPKPAAPAPSTTPAPSATPPAPGAPAAAAPGTTPPATAAPAPAPPAPKSILPKGWEPSYSVGGYVEAGYTYAFEKPSNGIINERGFDNRHNTFTIQNAVIDAQGKLGGLSARVALQVGRTPDTYYMGEPSYAGSSSVPPSTPSSWRFVQQAYAGYKFPVANGLTLDAGIFLSPIGLETMAAKDDWNYSRSNLFFALPFYHTGVRLTLDVTERTSFMLMVTNGYNSVVDNNAGKSVMSQFTYKIPDKLVLGLLYMGGPERPSGAPEGQPWRHLVDGYVSGQLASWLELATEWDAGFERTRYGMSYFGAGAIYARFHPASWLYLAARGDRIAEHVASSATGAASPMFVPVRWISSGTFTFDARPHDHVSLRLEYRHDQASDNLYFEGDVKGDGTKTPYVPNARAQNTITAAAVAWF
jgi:hypothetical protein